MARRAGFIGLALVLAAALQGCTAAGGTGVQTPGQRFTARGGGATHYTTLAVPDGALRGPHADAVQRGLARAQAAQGATLAPDARLAELANEVASALFTDGSMPEYAARELWTRHLGLTEPAPLLFALARADAQSVEEAVAAEATRFLRERRYTHYGAVTLAEAGGIRAVLAMSTRMADIAPLPRTAAPGDRLVLQGKLLPGVHTPQLIVSYPDGTSERGKPQTKPAFDFELRTRGPGEYRIELIADSQLGPTVVVNVPVYVGISPPISITAGVQEDSMSAGDASARLLALANGDREKAGLPPLAAHPELARIATAHSADMLENGYFGHTSPTTGTAADRVTRAGMRTPLVRENIGHGYSVSEVHRSLMESPGHRDNVLSDDATHVGIGVLVAEKDGRNSYVVTELFIRLAAAIDVDDAPERLLAALNAARAKRGAAALLADDGLADLAGGAAQAYFRGEGATEDARKQLDLALRRKATQTGRPYASLITELTALDEVASIEGLLDKKARTIGFGVAQGTRPGGMDNAIALVVCIGY